MNTLPKDIENIVNDYKHQMEHKDRFLPSLEIITNIYHTCYQNKEGLNLSNRTLHNGPCEFDSVEYFQYIGSHSLYVETHYNSNSDSMATITTMIFNTKEGVCIKDMGISYN